MYPKNLNIVLKSDTLEYSIRVRAFDIQLLKKIKNTLAISQKNQPFL